MHDVKKIINSSNFKRHDKKHANSFAILFHLNLKLVLNFLNNERYSYVLRKELNVFMSTM